MTISLALGADGALFEGAVEAGLAGPGLESWLDWALSRLASWGGPADLSLPSRLIFARHSATVGILDEIDAASGFAPAAEGSATVGPVDVLAERSIAVAPASTWAPAFSRVDAVVVSMVWLRLDLRSNH